MSSFAELLLLPLPYKKPCRHWPPEYIATHSQPTGYLRPCELDTTLVGHAWYYSAVSSEWLVLCTSF